MPHEMPEVRIATFSTCARAGNAPQSTIRNGNIAFGKFVTSRLPQAPLPVSDEQRDPTPDDHEIQKQTPGEHSLDGELSPPGRTGANQPNLVGQRQYRHGKKEWLQPLKPELASRAQQ